MDLPDRRDSKVRLALQECRATTVTRATSDHRVLAVKMDLLDRRVLLESRVS